MKHNAHLCLKQETGICKLHNDLHGFPIRSVHGEM